MCYPYPVNRGQKVQLYQHNRNENVLAPYVQYNRRKLEETDMRCDMSGSQILNFQFSFFSLPSVECNAQSRKRIVQYNFGKQLFPLFILKYVRIFEIILSGRPRRLERFTTKNLHTDIVAKSGMFSGEYLSLLLPSSLHSFFL